MKALIVKCEEETRWWRAVKRRCKEIVGHKPAMNLEEFNRVIGFEVSAKLHKNKSCAISLKGAKFLYFLLTKRKIITIIYIATITV